MCWLWTPGGPWREAIEADVDVSVGGLWALDEVTSAARQAGRPARVQLKADTGLGRGGCQPGDWAELVAGARRAEAEGLLKVTGLWSHFACADEPGHPSIAAPSWSRSGRWWRTPRRRAWSPRCGTSPTRPRP